MTRCQCKESDRTTEQYSFRKGAQEQSVTAVNTHLSRALCCNFDLFLLFFCSGLLVANGAASKVRSRRFFPLSRYVLQLSREWGGGVMQGRWKGFPGARQLTTRGSVSASQDTAHIHTHWNPAQMPAPFIVPHLINNCPSSHTLRANSDSSLPARSVTNINYIAPPHTEANTSHDQGLEFSNHRTFI